MFFVSVSDKNSPKANLGVCCGLCASCTLLYPPVPSCTLLYLSVPSCPLLFHCVFVPIQS